ncbi:helix-turn-helix domain-containing protein [Kushneria sp. AK178]
MEMQSDERLISLVERMEAALANQPEQEVLLSMNDVCDRTGYSSTKMYQMVRDGHFPAGRRMFNGGVRWRAADVNDWIKQEWERSKKV